MQLRTHFKLILFSVFFLQACTGGGSSKDPGTGNSSLKLSSQQVRASADSSGSAQLEFTLPAGSTAFQIASSAGSLSALSGPEGDLFNRADLVSSLQKSSVSNVSYYSSIGLNGGTYRAVYSAVAGQSVVLEIFSKTDVSLNSGTLKLNIVLLGPVGGSQDVLDALDKALEAERITFGRKNISLDTQISNFDGPGVAPLPGDPLYQSIVAAQRPASVTVVIAADRKGTKSNQFKYGTIGATPFPIIANANSVAVISVKDITGGDGVFNSSGGGQSNNEDQNRLLGEEIGRFAAMALGLPPLVTTQGSNSGVADNIPDSPSCITKQACQNDPGSRTNLMYPEPLQKLSEDKDSGTGNKFYPRDQLSNQQGQVLNNSVFVD